MRTYSQVTLLLLFAKYLCGLHTDQQQTAAQYPEQIITETGNSAQVYCIHTLPGLDHSNSIVYWLRKYPTLNTITTFRGNSMIYVSKEYHDRVTVQGEIRGNISLLIKNLTVIDSGVYACEIVKTNPPPSWVQRGTGTNITVTEKVQAAIQYPSEIKTEAGSSAQIHCIHSLPKLDDSNSLVYWTKSYPSSNQVMSLRGNHILYTSDEFQGRVQAHGEISYNISLLLKNLSVNDSGVYICEVVKTSPPPTWMQRGNGTFITVTEADHTTSSLQLTSRNRQSIFTVTNICVVGGLSTFLLVTITLLGVLLYARVRRHRSLLQLSSQCQERDKSSFSADLKENMYVDGTMEDTIRCDVYQELIITKTPVYDTLLVKSSNQDHH
ncbi:uncharacterized protein LOC114650872 [Erpetoichthys calabaricus]|uniref:uncharacterized protein LOC114650872 n=1 Tax=Erpetoichthys calabaricus TaxID=27687 RepID=UPI00109F7CB5|nr:uncharacterized protein LOC114650872 [Erpetoichthys calabaricus]